MKHAETLRQVCKTVFDFEFPDEFLSGFFDWLVEGMGAPSLPAKTETAAFGFDCPKTAALCFDRVWGIGGGDFPSSIAFQGGTSTEVEILALLGIFFGIEAGDRGHPQFVEPEMSKRLKDRVGVSLFSVVAPGEDFDPNMTGLQGRVARRICRALAREHDIVVTPVLASDDDLSKGYRPGDLSAVFSTLSGVPVVDEKRLDWPQVCEFRKDQRAKSDFRRLLHWLDAEMVGKTHQFIQDEVAVRLENYDRAIRKHGIETVIGTLGGLLDSRFLAGGSIATLAANIVGGNIGAAAAASALLVGQASIQIARVLTDLESKKKDSAREIAFVIEARKLGGA